MKTQEDNTEVLPQVLIKEETSKHRSEAASDFRYSETRELVKLVTGAAALVREKGEAAFSAFRLAGSQWRKGDAYIFILDPKGNMLVHADPEMEGKNHMDLEDVNGKPIIHGLLAAALDFPDKPEGWYHYQWPVPGGLLPRWKSSYVKLVKAPSGKSYVLGSGMYNDRMEREFVVDAVKNAVGQIERNSEEAFRLFHDPKGPFLVKDAYVFVIDLNGIALVNPAFQNLEGQKLLDVKDTQGKFMIREMIDTVQTSGSGWVNYMWPKPGESVSTQKSAFVSKARFGKEWVMVGCGVYLADAPREARAKPKMSAPDLTEIVRQAADILKEQGEKAYSEFSKKGSRWFHDETYFFVFTMDGVRAFHAAEPESAGRNDSGLKDSLGRPIVKMILEAGSGPYGEGWVHYMYPEPGDIFPAWKSSFVKRVKYPSGKQYIVGCGIYNMQMDKSFIEDVVNRAAAIIAQSGKESFARLRDKKGPFIFMDTYVFVLSPEGIELVNAAQPVLEGTNIIDLKDLKGKAVIKDEISAAMTEGSAWMECYWYRPGDNAPALKQSYLRKVQFNSETYIVGSGIYGAEGIASQFKMNDIQKIAWQSIDEEKLNDKLSRQAIYGEKGTLAKFQARTGAGIARHYHMNEEYSYIVSGALKFKFDDREVLVHAGEVIVIPPNVPHSIMVLEDALFLDFFAPLRTDWLRGEDQYLRK